MSSAELEKSSGHEGARLIQDRETRLAALDASIARGLGNIDAGRMKPAAEVFDRLAKKYAEMNCPITFWDA